MQIIFILFNFCTDSKYIEQFSIKFSNSIVLSIWKDTYTEMIIHIFTSALKLFSKFILLIILGMGRNGKGRNEKG